MTSYTLREVQQIAGLTRSVIAGFIQAGFVEPALGKRREYRFTFQDLIVTVSYTHLTLPTTPYV